AAPPTSGRVALVAHLPVPYDARLPHSGLLLDEWVERIPSTTQSTGLTFHFEEPKAQAPQALLLAVAPANEASWSDDLLLAILNETPDLAKVRTVDPDPIRDVGQILPALFSAFNAEGHTVSSQFTAPRRPTN